MGSSHVIGLVVHPSKDVHDSIDRLRSWAAKAGTRLIACEADATRVGSAIELVSDAAFRSRVDAVVSLGGDGTMLGAMRSVADNPVPVIGVNYGNLGFLVEVEPHELDIALERIDSDDFQIEPHHALEVSIDGQEFLAFNDVSIARRPGSGVVSADLRVDDVPYGYYKADALVIATSAGSTAYNYAAGGPVLSPALAASVVTPVAPMSGIDRSVVLDHSEHMHLVMGDETGSAALEIDGRVVADVTADSEVGIRMRKDAGMVIRLDAERHANKGKLKLSLLDLPLRRDQLLELVPAALRDR
jgi:NAD+ kinase